MSKVVRVQEGDYKVLLGKDGTPKNFIIDTNFGSINAETGEVIINGDLVVTGSAPSPKVSNVMYVTMDGDDANDGFGEGPTQAKRTIKSAVESAQEGTTIFVRSGEYYEDNPIRMPPKVSLIGDNLRRTILRPLNGPRKFSATSVERTGTVVTVTTSTPHEFKLYDRVRVIIPNPATPKDRTTHILDTECANISEIVNATTFKYIDPNFTDIPFTTTTIGTVEQGIDFFLVNNQSYIAQLVFKGFQAPGYCLNIDRDAIVDTSPYIQNCSNINGPWLRNGTEWLPFITEQPNLNGEMVKGPRPLRDDEIDPAQVDQYGVNERGAGGGMLIDGDRYNSESPLKSMVADAFTQVAQGAVGFHISNFGYMQLVSCFAVFCDKAFYTSTGGYMSISNSVIDFGNYGFIADGYYPTPYATGLVTQPYYSTIGSITVTGEGLGYTSIPNAIIEPPTTVLEPAGPGRQATSIVNVDLIRGTINAITPNDPGAGYTFVPEITIDPPFMPFVPWQSGLAVTNGQYILQNRAEYQVVGNGTLGLEPPNHSSGTQPNGTINLTFVGVQATATVNLATNISIIVNQLSEKPQVGSIVFVGDDPIGYYIKATTDSELDFKFNEIKCRRDVKYIVDAVLADAVFDTNFRTLYAARAYLRSYSSKVLSLQKAQTLNGILVAKQQIQSRLPSGLASQSLPSGTVANKINNLFNLVISVIFPEFNPDTDLPGDPSVPSDGIQENDPRLVNSNPDPNFDTVDFSSVLTYPSSRTQGFVQAGQILQANKQFLQDQIISYINETYIGVGYDPIKCARDVGIIVEAVFDDLVFGSNYKSKTAGLSYLRSYSSKVTESQKAPTIAGIERARDLVLKYLQDEYDSEVTIRKLFDLVADIIRKEDYLLVEPTFYTTPRDGNEFNARQLETNKQQLINNTIGYINQFLDPRNIVNYSERLCRRDLNFIIEGLIFDRMYSGNSATVNVAKSFYSASGQNVVSTQIEQHELALNFLKFTIDDPSTSTLIDIIINAIRNGEETIPVATPPSYTRGSLFLYYEDERTKILGTNPISNPGLLPGIKDDVIDFIDTKYRLNFNYNQDVCRRDIDYIVDALSYDLIYGGNTQITNAALAYSEGSVIAGEIFETVGAYKYWKDILPLVLQNIPVPNAVNGQITNIATGGPIPPFYPSFIAQNLLQILIDAIDYGPSFVPEPVTESNFLAGSTLVNDFKNTIKDDVINDIQNAVINYLNIKYGGNVTVQVFPGIIEIPENTPVKFHNVSTISTGGTALEYVGAGVTYNALPFFGGEPIPEQERNEINNGRCFTVTNDQVGNFRVGQLFAVDALTGGVTIDANNVNLSGISSIGPFKRNGIPVGVELQEVSNNPNLISSIGTQDVNTVPTQQAVATYVENRYLNKVQGVDPQTVASEVTFENDVTIEGNLTVNGATTTVNSVTLTVDDKNIELGSIETPTDVTADGGGITLKGTTDKTIIWTDASDAWNSSEHLNLANTKVYRINETDVLSSNGVLNNTSSATAFSTATTLTIGSTTGTTTIRNDNVVLNGDLDVRGGDITTNQTTFNLVNATATTLNIGGAATSLTIGANNSGTTTIRNSNTVVSGDLSVNGGDLLTSETAFNLLNTTATTINAFGAATTLTIGANTGTVTVRNPTVVGTSVTQSLYNTVATTVNAFGEAASLTLGATTGTATIRNASTTISGNASINGGTLSTTAATFNLVNTISTTVNFAGAATSLTVGAITGTTRVRNNLDVDGSIEVGGNIIPTVTNVQDLGSPTNRFRDLYLSGDSVYLGTAVLTEEVLLGLLEINDIIGGNSFNSDAETFNLLNTNTTTINAFGDATTVNIGSTTGTTTIRNENVVLDGNLEVRGGNITTNATTFNLLNTTATTVNAFGAASDINIGANSGTLTINNNQVIFNSTDSIRIPVGTTAQRDSTPEIGQIRYNSELNTFEGFGPGNAWGSLGGVRDVDGNTYIIPETSPGANENILYFYNNGVLTATLEQTSFSLSNGVPVRINDVTGSDATNTGALRVSGGVGIAQNVNIGGTLTVAGNSALNGANLTTTQTTFNLLNTTATTVNAFGAATTLVLASTVGTTNIRNNLDVDGDIHLDGGDLTASTSTFNLLNTTVNNLNFAGAADTIVIGGTSGTTTIRNTNVILSGDLEIRGGDLTTNQSSFNVLNTVATTVNAFGSTSSLTVGATTGTTTIRNANVVLDGDLSVNGGDLTTTQTTFNLLNTTATTVNAFGAATTLNLGLFATDFNIGASTGTLTVRNAQTVFASTDSIRIPVGTTAQRDSTPEIGQIRYNSQLSTFEGFGPGNNWGSLGGVKDVDGDTFIIAELTPGANDNTLYFQNGGVQTLTITSSTFDLKSPVRMVINNTTNSTSSTTGALVVAGGIGVANDIVGAGWITSSIQQFEIDEGEY